MKPNIQIKATITDDFQLVYAIPKTLTHRLMQIGAGIDVVVTVKKFVKSRSVEQNKLQRKWLKEAAEQLQEFTAEEYRGFCKLHFGVPILINENEYFAKRYMEVIKPMPYETKIQLMQEPFDFPVTRLMTTKQKTVYLDKVFEHFTGLGVRLTIPERKQDGQNRKTKD